MNKEEKIVYLLKFQDSIEKWFELRNGVQNEKERNSTMDELASMWGVVSEILKEEQALLDISNDELREKTFEFKKKIQNVRAAFQKEIEAVAITPTNEGPSQNFKCNKSYKKPSLD